MRTADSVLDAKATGARSRNPDRISGCGPQPSPSKAKHVLFTLPGMVSLPRFLLESQRARLRRARMAGWTATPRRGVHLAVGLMACGCVGCGAGGERSQRAGEHAEPGRQTESVERRRARGRAREAERRAGPRARSPSAAAPSPPPATRAAAPEPARQASPQSEGAERGPGTEAAAEKVAAVLALSPAQSTSVGWPQRGRLEGGAALPGVGPGFISNPRRPNPSAIYGTVELIQALVRAAGRVADASPGGMLTINDIALPAGGDIPHHGSHRTGRDVDVLFYLLEPNGEPRPSVGAFLDPRGRGVDFKDLLDPSDDVDVRLDAARTWAFVEALLEGPHRDDVQRIFVVEHIRALLLEAAQGAAAETRARFEMVTCQPGYPHDDHLHIRFYCSVEDLAAGCEDSPPVYPFRRAALRRAGLRPTIHRLPRRRRTRSPSEAAARARAKAGPMHPRVARWLDRRNAWFAQPHPGRPYCR